MLSLAYNLPLLAAVIAMAQYAHSFRLGALQHAHFGVVTALAAIAFLVAIPARLKSNPFSIPNAEQEIVAGAHIEYNSAPLAIFELSHALEVVLLFDAFFVLFVPRFDSALANAALYFSVSLGPDRAGDPGRRHDGAAHGEAGVSILLGLGRVGRGGGYGRRGHRLRGTADGHSAASSGGISVAARGRGRPDRHAARPRRRSAA